MKMLYRLILIVCFPLIVFGQCDPGIPPFKMTPSGKLFYLTFMQTDVPEFRPIGPLDSQTVFLVTLDKPADVELTCRAYPSYRKVFNIPANSYVSYKILEDIDPQIVGSEYINGKSVKVVSSEPIVCIAASTPQFRARDLFLGASDAIAGMEYRSMNYSSVEYSQALYDPPYVPQFNVTAFQSGTQVTITPTEMTMNASPRGIPLTYVLDSGQCVQIQSEYVRNNGKDLTGSKIYSTKPVAVYSGHTGAQVPPGPVISARGTGSSMYEAMPPVSTWGKHFLFQNKERGLHDQLDSVLPSIDSSDYIRVLALDENTTVKLNGIEWDAPFNANEYRDKKLFGTVFIESDKPVLVADYAHSYKNDTRANDTAGAFFAILPPLEQTFNEFTFFVSIDKSLEVIDSGIAYPYQFVQIAVERNNKSNLMLDGNPIPVSYFKDAWGSFNGRQYSIGSVPVTPGRHTVRCPGIAEQGFVLLVYGFGNRRAYGYSAGSLYRPLRGIVAADPPAGLPKPGTEQNVVYFRNILVENAYLDSVKIILPDSLSQFYSVKTRERVWQDLGKMGPGTTAQLHFDISPEPSNPIPCNFSLYYHTYNFRSLEPFTCEISLLPKQSLNVIDNELENLSAHVIYGESNDLTIAVASPVAKIINLRLYSIHGELMLHKALELNGGSQIFKFPESKFSSGFYSIQLGDIWMKYIQR